MFQLEQEITQYLEKVVQGTKISLEQLEEYFNVSQEDILYVLSEIENRKDLSFKGSIKKEFVGTFFEIISNQALKHTIESFDKILEKQNIRCYNCGREIESTDSRCPHCNYVNLACSSCLKYIQYNDVKINCPHCYQTYHFSCFESKVKLFDRCPNCREIVDFDSLKTKTISQKKKQDDISDSLSRLVGMKSKFVKKHDEEEDDLFDF